MSKNKPKETAPTGAETTKGKLGVTIRPLGSRVLVKLISPDKKKGDILLPDAARVQDYTRATVVAIGPDVPQSITRHDQSLKVGDMVALPRVHSTITVSHQGEEHKLVHLDDVLAIIEA